tara:strand:+ start:418 stop:1548 length:1131 start_codon:yes stop_codon:yes gene_type:complete
MLKKKKIKVVTLFGTRPEIIRLSSIIKKFDKYFDHTLINTNQNFDYELSDIFFKDLKLKKADYNLNCANKNPGKTIGKIIEKSEILLKKINPDVFFVLGDTNSSLSSIAAKKLRIPIFHYEAGNRCNDQRVPEEINRKIVDHIADINLTYSQISKSNLLNEGIPERQVIAIGSPLYEVINKNISSINNSKVKEKLKIKKQQYYLFSIHREETVESKDSLKTIFSIIETISKNKSFKVVISAHPRLKKKMDNYKFDKNNLIINKPFSFTEYCNLQKNSRVVVSDSGTINEESSILRFKAINLRNTHERHEANEETPTLMSSVNIKNFFYCLDYLETSKFLAPIVREYNVSDVSEKIARIIYSYRQYVKNYIYYENNF